MDFLIIEASRHTITATRFQCKGKALTFTGAITRPLENEESLGLLLQEHAAGEDGKEKVILSLDPSSFYSREMELPIRDRNKLREILPLELKGETAVDTDELIFDTVPLQGQKLLAIWAKRADIAQLIATMLKAGLEPQVVTSAPFHWQTLLPDTADGFIAISDGAALAVYHDREPIYIRSMGEGEPAREIEKTLAALEIGKEIKVGQVFLIGSAAHAGEFTLTKMERAESSIVTLAVTGELAEAFADNSAMAVEHAGAWSLARENLSGGTVNFRHGELSYTAGFEKIKKKLRLTAILAALLVLLLFVETGIRYYLVKKDFDSINASIQGIYHEVFPGRKKPVDEVAEIRSEIKRMGGGAATQDLLGTLKRIAELKNDGINGFFETEIDGNQLRLKGDAVSFQAVNDFKARAGSQFATAEVGEIKSRPDGSVSFTFRGTLQEGSK